jgi:N4-gp56 family major capsid protein
MGTLIADITTFIPTYWDAVLGENLYPNLYFYQFGTKRTVPRNFGNTIKVPRLKKQNIVASLTEGSPVATCKICSQFISGTMSQFGGAYRHSDLVVMTALSDMIDLSVKDIARDIARRMDRTIRNSLSTAGALITGGFKGIVMHANDVLKATVTLDSADNPRPPDNCYPTIIHPNTVFDLMTNLTGGNWIDVIKYTEGNVSRAFIGEVGRLYGARFVTSNNIRRVAMSGGVSGTMGFMFAPDAYYVTEISDMTAKTYVKQLGSAGAADPINQFATVGAKVFFGCVPATWTSTEFRVARLQFKNTIAGGDTTA